MKKSQLRQIIKEEIRRLLKEFAGEKYKSKSRPNRMKAIKTGNVRLRSQDRPVDYGHCNQIFIDKYGEKKGEEAYEKLFVNANNNFGWTLASNIQKEKLALLDFFGESVPSDLDDVAYFPLWEKWMKEKDKKK